MFFIVPEPKPQNSVPTPHPEDSSQSPHSQKRQHLSPEEEESAGYYPKRTLKACDRCRLKKARCSGGKICEKCKRDGVICTFNRESKREPKPPNAAYVQLVESQRDSLLRALSKIFQTGVSNDPTAIAKIFQEVGIRVEDLKRAPKQRPSDDVPEELEDADIYQNVAEIKALLDEWNAAATKPELNLNPTNPGLQDIKFQPDNQSKAPLLQTYFNSPPGNDMPPDFSAAPSAFPAEALSSFDMLYLSSTNSEDWPAGNSSTENWSLPNVDFMEGRPSNITGTYSAS
ncbi:uncharacterized protein Z518_05878 [Rhinocladiella mackenziei CBS 650.93]|uniref:Zn(2)-C6 fungal-type domain-containing protein n=1 Tax=Rhinocladiella mackenziei CBS 650.93 TaxID=1442369 RepID=A0A0D2IPF3_9EURO|nr:uncharacterized protein Z518_05878 [Rhinocladiella mackenziei CBS 650.93]KIX05006.1 hypothetical protein Z518_05878 [Rhinocladiella mackenziei CBS 650.93]